MSKNISLTEVVAIQNRFSQQSAKMTLQELFAIKEEAVAMIKHVDDEYVAIQDRILPVFRVEVKKHLQAHVKYAKNIAVYAEYFKKISDFYSQLASAQDFLGLDIAIESFISFCQVEERNIPVYDYRFSDKLKDCRRTLRMQGLLPRDFSRDLQPEILSLIKSIKNDIRKTSAIVRWNGQIFACLENSVSSRQGDMGPRTAEILNETDLANFLTTVEAVLHGRNISGMPAEARNVFSEIAEKVSEVGLAQELQFVGIFRTSTRKATNEAIQQLHNKLVDQGWLKAGQANENAEKQKMLLQLLSDVLAQITFRQEQLSTQLSLYIHAHQMAIQQFIKPRKYSPQVKVWLVDQLETCRAIFSKDMPLEENDMKLIRKQYQQFWLGFIRELDRLALHAQNDEQLYLSRVQKDWLSLRDNAYVAASFLRSDAKTLVTTFADFDVPYIIKELKSHLNRSYRFSLFSCSEHRREQQLRLENRLLSHGDSPVTVGLILDQEIKNIANSHSATSKAHNFLFWRRNSRSVVGLSNFFNLCAKRGWAILPETTKVLLLEQTLREQMESYFDRFLFGSLTRRGVVARVLSVVYEVKVKLTRDKSYTQWQGMNQIANALANVIHRESEMHEQAWTTKVLRFFGCACKDEFIENLSFVQQYAQQQKYLPKSFVATSASAIIASLNSLRENIVALSEDNTLLNKLTKLNGEKQQAMIDISVLIKHIEEQCIDYPGASLAVSQLLDKFENEEYYQNPCFHKYLQSAMQVLQSQGHLLARDQVLGDHLKSIQKDLISVHAQAQALRTKASC